MFTQFILLLFLVGINTTGVIAADKTLHVYNWSDYIDTSVVKDFENTTGIKVIYDVYDNNDVLEAKLLAGQSGYDLVFPTARPFAERHIKANIYKILDKKKLSNYANLDPTMMNNLAEFDTGNRFVVPYMWGTTGIGYNVDKVTKILGANVSIDSWEMIFDPNHAQKLAACGISILDDEHEGFAAALLYLGKDPNTTDANDIESAVKIFKAVKKYIKYFHSSKYISDLANGDICVALGYSGDILQAKARAEEAKNHVSIAYVIPKEGAVIATDVMAIPNDAPHADHALQFIDYVLNPNVIAKITNFVAFANAVPKATPLLDESIRTNPGIYPSSEVQTRLRALLTLPDKVQKLRTRTWSKIKTL